MSSDNDSRPGVTKTIALSVAAIVILLSGVVIFGSDKPKTTEDPCNPNAGSSTIVNVPTGSTVKPMRAGTYQLTSGFGPRWGSMHQGQDLAGPGEPDLLAFADGTIREAGPAQGFGQWIILDFNLAGKKYSAVYGHMFPQGVSVKTGDTVKAGQVIGKQGNNGDTTGPHLHFEIWDGGRLDGGKAVDPAPFLASAIEAGGSPTTGTPGTPQDPAADPSAPRGPPAVDLVAQTNPAPGVGCSTAGGAGLDESKVPAEFIPWIKKAAALCPQITAPLIAAQLENESGFNVNAVSPANAIGPAQFIPSTWEAEAVDGDGDGKRDPRSIADAVMSQGKLDCKLIAKYERMLAEKKVVGDPIELMLSAYNCGEGSTDGGGRVCQNGETLRYVKNIPARARDHFAVKGAAVSAGFGANIVAAARSQLGVKYAWAGGNANGPSEGQGQDAGIIGYDCSGLTLYAVAQAARTAGRTLELPHLTNSQNTDPRGTPVPVDEAALQPGDLVFQKGMGHVVIYAGAGKVIDAPESGKFVQEIPFNTYQYESARRFS